VVLTDYVWDSLEVERQALAGLADLVALRTSKPEEFLGEAADCDALLNTYAGPITGEVMARMPRCKIIARYGIGVDTIDVEAATRAGIIVTNNPTYCIEEVAEHAMALLLACARKVAFYDRMVRGGRWEVPPGKPLFRLAGSTLGLVGFGHIARQVAIRAAAFGLRVLFHDPYVAAAPPGVPGEPRRTLDEVLPEADLVSLHPPLTPETRRLLGDAALARMKPSAWLVNCARGPIVDTDALVRALDQGRIAGCALDTVDPEPLPDPHPLRGRENVILNPHVAWYSEQSVRGLQAGAPAEVRRVLSGEWPVNVVNRTVKGKNRAGL
jgi:D-3-phosphoglycerate dehydrogenase